MFRARVFLSVSFGELRAAGALGSNAIAPPRQEPEAIVLYLVYPIVAYRSTSVRSKMISTLKK